MQAQALRMVTNEKGSQQPKPKVEAKPPQNSLNSADPISKHRSMFGLFHLAFDPKFPPPLCNLHTSMLQRISTQTERFSSGTGPLKGLEMMG